MKKIKWLKENCNYVDEKGNQVFTKKGSLDFLTDKIKSRFEGLGAFVEVDDLGNPISDNEVSGNDETPTKNPSKPLKPPKPSTTGKGKGKDSKADILEKVDISEVDNQSKVDDLGNPISENDESATDPSADGDTPSAE